MLISWSISVSFRSLHKAPMDYVPMDSLFRLRGGQFQETELYFSVQIRQDSIAEPTEEFFLDVVAIQNVIVLTPVITVRILGIGT